MLNLGSGKTTLLNFLSGRDKSSNLQNEGTVLINGTNKDDLPNFSAYSAYVQQDDILFQTMTVRECFEFAAKLKLGGVTAEAKMQRVEDIINDLKMVKCQNTKIGGPLVKGVSGGERKRTSIGVELITDPSLIFLDEPTTGLDSFTASHVMEILLDLAKKNKRTVFSTIHQPNSDCFEIFDRLLLLARGKIIYFNEANLAVDYFKSIGYNCPDLTNPADYFMTIMSIENIELEVDDGPITSMANHTAKIEAEYAKQIDILDSYYQSTEDLKNDPTAQHPDVTPLTGNEVDITVQTSFFFQFNLLARRNFLNLLRLPQTSYVKLLTTCMTAIFAVLLFYDSGFDEAGIQNKQGALFFITMNISFNAIQNIILIFPDERPVFLREVGNNMYNTGPYFWAKVISELPFSIMTPTIFGCIVYWFIGFNPNFSAFLTFLLTLILIYNASSGYSLIISASFSDKQMAVTLTPVLIIPFMLFAGFFVSSENIGWYLKEFEYLSIFKWGYQALMYNQFQWYIDGGPEGTDYETYACLTPTDGRMACEPLSQVADNPQVNGCLGALVGIYSVCYLSAWWILSRLSGASK